MWLGWHDGVDERLQLSDVFFSSFVVHSSYCRVQFLVCSHELVVVGELWVGSKFVLELNCARHN